MVGYSLADDTFYILMGCNHIYSYASCINNNLLLIETCGTKGKIMDGWMDRNIYKLISKQMNRFISNKLTVISQITCFDQSWPSGINQATGHQNSSVPSLSISP